MRRAFLAQLTAIASMALAMWFFQTEGDHIYYSGHDTAYKILSGSGFLLLLIAFLTFMIASDYLSAKLPAAKAMLVGLGILVTALIAWKLLNPYVAMDYWTMMLVIPPAICLLGGVVLIVVGTIRVIVSWTRAQLH